MSNSTIVIPIEEIDLRVSGRRITALPATGPFLTIEKVSPLNVVVEGLHNTLTHLRNNSKLYRATVTVKYGHPDDAFFMGSVKLQELTPMLLSFSFMHGSTKFSSVNCSIETMPNVEIAADGVPTRAYPLVGTFPNPIIGMFKAPQLATEEQILALVPPAP